MIRNDSIDFDQNLAENHESLSAGTEKNAYRSADEADSDFLVKVQMVLCTAEVTTGLFFEKFYQKFGKVVDEYYMKYYRFHQKKTLNCTINSKGGS